MSEKLKERVRYQAYEISPDGLLKRPEFRDGWGYVSSTHQKDTKEEVIQDLKNEGVLYREFVILEVVDFR